MTEGFLPGLAQEKGAQCGKLAWKRGYILDCRTNRDSTDPKGTQLPGPDMNFLKYDLTILTQALSLLYYSQAIKNGLLKKRQLPHCFSLLVVLLPLQA